jgi:hypothetical protein
MKCINYKEVLSSFLDGPFSADCAVDLLESVNSDKDCSVSMVYDRTIVAVGNPSSLPSPTLWMKPLPHYPLLYFPSLLLMRSPEARYVSGSIGCNQFLVR